MGAVTSEQSALSGHKNYRVNSQGRVFGGSLKKISTFFSLGEGKASAGLRYSGPKTINAESGSVNLGYSAIINTQWNNGWNASVGVDLNLADASITQGDTFKGNKRAGIYAEINAWTPVVGAVLVAAALTPIPDELIVLERLRRIPQLLPAILP